jgi:hypothetical protein
VRDTAVAAIHTGRRLRCRGSMLPQGSGYSRTAMPSLLSGSMYWRTRALALGTISPPVYAATRTARAPVHAQPPSAAWHAG